MRQRKSRRRFQSRSYVAQRGTSRLTIDPSARLRLDVSMMYGGSRSSIHTQAGRAMYANSFNHPSMARTACETGSRSLCSTSSSSMRIMIPDASAPAVVAFSSETDTAFSSRGGYWRATRSRRCWQLDRRKEIGSPRTFYGAPLEALRVIMTGRG